MKNISGSISYAKFKFSVAGTQIKFGHRIDGWPKSPAPNQFVTSAINYHSAWTLTTYFEASISIVAQTGKLIVFKDYTMYRIHIRNRIGIVQYNLEREF